jgi:hypothetical protein
MSRDFFAAIAKDLIVAEPFFTDHDSGCEEGAFFKPMERDC